MGRSEDRPLPRFPTVVQCEEVPGCEKRSAAESHERDGKENVSTRRYDWQMDHGVWTFVRGGDTLEIRRQTLDDGTVLAITGGGVPRSYFFEDFGRLEIFQKDMETLLLKTGWSFVSYAPDQRTGRDRRGWPRRANDRRRWWTDGSRLNMGRDGKPDTETASPGQDEDQPRTSEK